MAVGARGPIPKRSEERRRRNAPASPVTQVSLEDIEVGNDPDSIEAKIVAGLPIPEPDADWHPTARRLFESLSHSGQAVFMQPSDWAIAVILCESLSRDLLPVPTGELDEEGAPVTAYLPLKGASISAYLKGFGVLGMTEGDRRRMAVELAPRVARKVAPVVDIDAVRAGRVGG